MCVGSTNGVSLDDCHIVPPLLEVLHVFARLHLDKLLAGCGLYSSSAGRQTMYVQIEAFLDHLAQATLRCQSAELTLKLILIWQSLLSLESTNEVVPYTI